MFWLLMACGGPPAGQAEETACDGKDDDGDGSVDEGLTVSRFPDEDGDGWGVTDPERFYYGCLPEAGWADQDGDCDDGKPLISPDAAEVCGDAVDDDCDGVAEGCNELDPERRAARYQPDGYLVAGPGLTVLADADGAGTPGFVAIAEGMSMADGVAVWVGADAGTVLSTDALLAYDEVTGVAPVEGGLAIGTHAAGLGRLDVRLGPAAGAATGGFARIGDGDPGDVASAVGGGDWLTTGPAVAWAWQGDTWGVGIDPLDQSGDLPAADVATTVEIDGSPSALLAVPGPDGVDDLLVVGVGATLFDGPLSGATALADAVASFPTASGGTAAAAVADLDGDGTVDVAIGDVSSDAVAVWLAPAAGAHDFDAADGRLDGADGVRAGAGLAAVDDLDGDGLAELLVGNTVGPSGVWVVTAPWGGTRSLDDAWRRVADADASYGVGATGGDLDGDTLPELLLGGSTEAGAAWTDLYLGSTVFAGP